RRGRFELWRPPAEGAMTGTPEVLPGTPVRAARHRLDAAPALRPWAPRVLSCRAVETNKRRRHVIKAAIYGLGRWGERLIESVQDSAKIRFVRGISRDPVKHEALAQRAGLRVVSSWSR